WVCANRKGINIKYNATLRKCFLVIILKIFMVSLLRRFTKSVPTDNIQPKPQSSKSGSRTRPLTHCDVTPIPPSYTLPFLPIIHNLNHNLQSPVLCLPLPADHLSVLYLSIVHNLKSHWVGLIPCRKSVV